MEVATSPMDVREWIYSLTKDVEITETTTLQQATGSARKAKGVFSEPLHEEVVIKLWNGEALTLPVGTEMAVYRKLRRNGDDTGWVYMPDTVLAAIWLKRGARSIEQITVRTTGRMARRGL